MVRGNTGMEERGEPRQADILPCTWGVRWGGASGQQAHPSAGTSRPPLPRQRRAGDSRSPGVLAACKHPQESNGRCRKVPEASMVSQRPAQCSWCGRMGQGLAPVPKPLRLSALSSPLVLPPALCGCCFCALAAVCTLLSPSHWLRHFSFPCSVSFWGPSASPSSQSLCPPVQLADLHRRFRALVGR